MKKRRVRADGITVNVATVASTSRINGVWQRRVRRRKAAKATAPKLIKLCTCVFYTRSSLSRIARFFPLCAVSSFGGA